MRATREWIARRLFPLIATGTLLAVGLASSTWWGPHFVGNTQWQLPGDLWGTLVAAQRLADLHLGGLYTQPTGLISLAGAALALVPVVLLMNSFGITLASPGPANPHPESWLLAGPYEIVLSCIVLFACDSLAERRGATGGQRFVLAAAEGTALWSVSVRWGHPEDALAVALLLYATIALADGRTWRSAWLVGLALSVQPLVVLALPVILVAIDATEFRSYLLRAATAPALCVGVTFAAGWRSAIRSLGNQPNWPSVDHSTPLTIFAPHMTNGAVASGPARAVAVFVAGVCALVAQRTWRRGPSIEQLLWWMAAALALRCVFEPVMVAYYVWPVLAVSLLCVSSQWTRLAIAGLLTAALTFAAQVDWRGRLGWWSMVLLAAAMVLVCTRAAAFGGSRSVSPSRQGSHDTWPFNKTYPTKAPVSIRL